MGAPQIFENLIQAKRLHSLSAPAPRIQDFLGKPNQSAHPEISNGEGKIA
jgi:hypothetical protein